MTPRIQSVGFALLAPLTLLPMIAAQGGIGGDKLTLKVGAAKGEVFHFKSTSKMSQSIDMGGQAMDSTNETVQMSRLKVVDVDAKDGATVELTVLSVRGSMGGPMGDITFDSTKKDDEGDEESGVPGMPGPGAIKRSLTVLAGKTFKARVGANGEVVEVMGLKE